MVRSLLIKLALLAATALVIVWIGWPTVEKEPDPAEPSAQVLPATDGQLRTDRAAARQHASTQGETRVDLNRASLEELQQLPGIGAVLAQRVVEWRKAHGPFRSVEELGSVKGIGAKKLARIKPLVTVSRQLKRTGAADQAPVAMAQRKDGL